MKQRFFMLVATILLMSTSVFAQNSENWDGDVNKDGVVDVADINAIIYLMKEAAGEYDGRIYYWYVGHVTNEQAENPNTLASIVTANGNSRTGIIGPSKLKMPTTTGDVLVYIYPTIWGTPTITYQNYGTGDGKYLEDAGLTPPSGYDIIYWDGDSSVRGKTLDITWTK